MKKSILLTLIALSLSFAAFSFSSFNVTSAQTNSPAKVEQATEDNQEGQSQNNTDQHNEQSLSKPGISSETFKSDKSETKKAHDLQTRTEKGELPLSRHYEYLNAGFEKEIHLSKLNESQKNSNNDKGRFRVGLVRKIDVPVNKISHGTKFSVKEGGIWLLKVKAEEAVQTRLHFNKTNLPEGAKVFVYSAKNPDEVFVYERTGASESGDFWTPPFEGESVVVEYFTPDTDKLNEDELPFEITEVSHIYKDPLQSRETENLGPPSQTCHNNVPAAWATAAKAVGHLQFTSGGGEYICTGTLLNNQIQDLDPILLTANHCFDTQAEAQSLRVYWHYNSGDNPSSSLPRSDGANLLSTGTGSDFTLVRILGSVPIRNYEFWWSGSNAGSIADGTPVVGIHHPSGSYKRYSSGSKISSYCPYGCSGHLGVQWQSGTTEGGSSGSGLFIGSAPGQLVGTLHGGENGCAIRDSYGSFAATYSSISSFMQSGGDDNFDAGTGNDTRAAAVNVSSGSYQSLVVKWVDSDWYKISLPNNTTLTLTVNFTHNYGDTDLLLFRGSETASVASSASTSNTETVTYTNTSGAPQDLFGHVNLYDGVRNVYNMSVSTSSCTYSLSSPNSPTLAATASSGNSFAVTAPTGCAWTSTNNAPSWITITGGTSGSGNGTVTYSVAANTGAARNGTITVGGTTFTVYQAANCTYSIDYSGWYAPKMANGTDQTVTTQSGCPWTAVSNVPWITVNSGNSGTGTGVFHWTAAENTGAARTGTITAAGQTITVNQDSAAPCSQTPISLGQTANGTLSTSDCMDYGAYIDEYNFSGSQGQRIAISMNSTEVDSQLKLLNSSGQEIANSNASALLTEESSMETNDSPVPSSIGVTENLSPTAANARLPNGSGYFTLPATGTYKIRARGNTGNYTLSLTSDCNAAINFGQTVTGSLSTSCVNASGQNFRSYTFSGTANQQIAIEMNSTAFDTYLELYNGTTLVTSNDDSGGTVNSRIPVTSGYFTLPATATYTIVARGYSASATGAFTLSLATQTTNPPSTAGLQYYPLAYPIRLLDTRSGQPTCYSSGSFTGYETIKTQPAQVTCQGLTIPATAQAIVGTATALNTPQGGNLRLYPAGEPLAEVSNVNFIPGRTVSNSFTVKLGTGGAFNIYSYSPSDVIIDVTGYYAAPGTNGLYYHQLPNPIRILETRPGEAGYQTPGAPLAANSVRLQQAGNITYLGVTIPASARAITGNATVVNNGFNSAGSVRLYPGDINQVPVTENINYVAGQTIPNAFTARLDSSGRFNIYTNAATHVLIDITGYYSTEPAADVNGSQGLLFNILPRPFRLLDTRAGFVACDAPGAKLSAQTVRVQTVRGRTCSNQMVPANAKAIFGNATVVNNFTGAGFGNIRLYPGEQPLANASNLNYVSGDVMPNSFIVGLGTTNGAMNIWSFSSTDFIVDVSGYFAAPTP